MFFYIEQKLEQEKHVLRQKLAIAEEESEQRVLEIQTDLNELKDKLLAQVQSYLFIIIKIRMLKLKNSFFKGKCNTSSGKREDPSN